MDVTLIIWNESLETGVGMIDAQHRILVGLINKLEHTCGQPDMDETAVSILHNLRQYTLYHFTAEETLMDRYGYGALEDHRREHRRFVSRLDEMELDSMTGAPDMGHEVLSFLRSWLVEHILESDMNFAEGIVDGGAKPRELRKK